MKSNLKKLIAEIKPVILHPVFILFVFNLFFFGKAIIGGLLISPADALQRFPSFNIDGIYQSPQNSHLMDAVTQFQPWAVYAKESLERGGFPLWNPHNAGGVPFFANMQSAILFPLSFIYYLLPVGVATVLVPFSKLFLIGIFTYFYIRELGVGKYESLVGAVAFNFAGFNIVWLLWPQSNVIMFLPLNFLLLEKYIQNKTNSSMFVASLGISFALSVFAGHPETLFHVSLVSTLYFIFRVITRVKKSQRRKKLASYIFAAFLGILLSAVQIVPFIEYLANSYAIVERGARSVGNLIAIPGVIYSIFPNIVGNPSTPFYRPIFNSSFHEGVGAYVGTIAIILASLSLILVEKKRELVLFYLLISLAVSPFVYQLPFFSSFGELANVYSANQRLIFMLAFSQAVLASLALNEFKIYPYMSKILRQSLIIIPILVLFILIGMSVFGNSFNFGISGAKLSEFLDYEKVQIVYFSVTLLIGILVIGQLKANNRKTALIMLSTVVFLQTGWLLKNYNPAIKISYFYPESEEMQVLERINEGRFMQVGGNYIAIPDINTFYPFPELQNYDAMDIRNYRKLYNELFENRESWNDQVIDTNEKNLDLFGVSYVGSYTDIDKELSINQSDADKYIKGLKEENKITTRFEALDDGLYAIRLLPANFNRVNNCKYRIVLSEKDNDTIQKEYDCKFLFDKIYTQYTFEPIKDSGSKSYTLEVEFVDGEGDISFWTDNSGELVLQTIYNKSDKPYLNKVHQGRFNIYENKNFRGDYFFVGNAVYLNEEEMIPYMRSSKFNPYQEVVLEGQAGLISTGQNHNASVGTHRVNATKDVIKLKTGSPGFLVSTRAYYPGWTVKINGKEKDFRRVNYAFLGVSVPEGENEIEIYYDPTSLKIGLVLTSLGIFSLMISGLGAIKYPIKRA